MADQAERTIRPVDILAMIRATNGDGFKKKDYTDGTSGGAFAPRSAQQTAVVVEDPSIAPVTPEPVIEQVSGISEAEVEHRVEAARAAAKAEGIAEERARLNAEIADERAQMAVLRATMQNVINRLSEVHPDDSANLAASIDQAVRRLASERAGVQIEETPDAFLKRIETLADRVSQGIRAVKIRLNPEDHAAILPEVAGSETIDTAMISVDATLGRGDVIVRCEAIRLEDVIAPNKAADKPIRPPQPDETA